MVAEYVVDQKDFHRRILRMATVIVDNDYAISEKEAVWSDDYYKDYLEGSSISLRNELENLIAKYKDKK